MAWDEEAHYDTEVAPLLQQAIEKCIERGLSFVVCVQFSDEQTASSIYLKEDSCEKLFALAGIARPDIVELSEKKARA